MLRTYMMRLNYQYSTLITLKNYSIEVILLERKKREGCLLLLSLAATHAFALKKCNNHILEKRDE